jgi:hypothetical protein
VQHRYTSRATASPSCNRSRHVDRRFFKVRELESAGIVKVEHVPTADNVADLLTKPLAFDAFARHRDTLLNL